MLSPTPIDRPGLHPGAYLIAPRVPHGLAAVVEGLTREVLRHRPEDIYVFAAHHFEKLLKLREQYYAEEYNDHGFNREFSREFNLWSTRQTEDARTVSRSESSSKKEIDESLEKQPCREYTDAEESTEDACTDRESREKNSSRNSKGFAKDARRVSRRSRDNETTCSDARAARIISQMSAAKSIQTKDDIKQELRRNKLSGEKTRKTPKDTAERGVVKGERRGRTKALKTKEDKVEETVRSTIATSGSSRTSAGRRPLRKVRRVETESETETESNANNENGITKARARTSEPRSSERRTSSRALSMDRIRAYVLRKFACTASLEVLRSPTYVEQVQEVIDRAAPIIKEKLEEIGRPRGKRSRSVDLAWNAESLRRHARDENKRRGDRDEEEEEADGGRKKDVEEKSENRRRAGRKEENGLARKESTRSAERERGKETRVPRSVGSASKRSRKRESGVDRSDFGVVDQVDDNPRRNSDKSEPDNNEPNGVSPCDTLEARLTATQNILEDISKMTTSELSGSRKVESFGIENTDADTSDANIVSLPIVRPPSSKNSRNASKNDSTDNLTLPPISPEAPKSTKKRDELSLPILPANGNHSKKSQEQDDATRDAVEEASTMRDITSDLEDTAILPEDSLYEDTKVVKNDLSDDCHVGLTSDAKMKEDEENREGEDKVPREDISENLAEKQGSFEELEKLIELEQEEMVEENFRDSLSVTPEVDLPPRPDSLEEEEKFRKNGDTAQNKTTFDGLKDKLIEIEMAERNIDKALAGQSTYENGRKKSSNKDDKGRKDVNEEKESVGKVKERVKEKDIEKSTETDKIENLKDKTAVKRAELADEVDGAEEMAIKLRHECTRSVDDRTIVEVTASKNDESTTTSKNEPESGTNKSSATTSDGASDEVSTTNIPGESNIDGESIDREEREADKSPAATPLSLEIPFAYVLSEGSPCEIPESVTTVIIPDRQYSSPAIAEDDQKERSLVLSDVEDKMQKKKTNQDEYGVEAFGEYIQTESAVSSADIDFAPTGPKGIKPIQDIAIAHQDLDRIKEEGEEEEEKEVVDKGDIEKETISEEKKDDSQAIAQNEEVTRLENIAEHEENEDIDAKTIPEGKEETEEVSSAHPEERSLPDIMEFVADTGLTDEERIDTVMESRSTLENSSEESTRDTGTTTSSDVNKEGLASPRSSETPSLPIPVVPELNLDSLQDNTVSSFKITASETKDDNGSPRESDATSLLEPLTSDERPMNRAALTDHDEEEGVARVEEHTGDDLARSELPEADQLYRAEHAEYMWLEKDPLSSEANLEDEGKSQGESIGLKTASGPVLRGEENDEELNSEEEIARELIGSLDEEMQLRADEFNSREKSEKELETSDLSANEKSNRPPSEFVQSVSVDESRKIEHEESSETMKTDDEKVTKRGEELDALSSHVTSKNGNDKDISMANKEHEESGLEVKEKERETEQIAPLAQFERDELLEKNDKIDNKITIEDVPDINTFIDNRELSREDKPMSIEKVIDTNESVSKDEELNKNQKENEQEKLQSQEKSMQEELQVREESKQEDLTLHEEGDKERLKLQEEIKNKEETSAEVIESRKDSINGSAKNKEEQEDKKISCDHSVSEKKEGIEGKKEENARTLSAEVETVRGPIVSAITEESTEDHSHDGYWTMGTKSSTVETTIEADGFNTSVDENAKAAVDEPEIVERDSLVQKKDDLYSAAVKIQACE